MIPGEIITSDGEITLNAGRRAITLEVANTSDRPVQVGSHYHFFETNEALEFEREKTRGYRLDIPAGALRTRSDARRPDGADRGGARDLRLQRSGHGCARPPGGRNVSSRRGVMEVVNLEDKFARFSEHWKPKILARLNDYHVKAVKLHGEFVWHKHDETDELFLVTRGSLVIRFRDRNVTLGAGDLLVVPKGVEHQPVAEEECELLLIEPAGTPNTGDAGGARTAEPEWI